jgi:hypothetical protein
LRILSAVTTDGPLDLRALSRELQKRPVLFG